MCKECPYFNSNGICVHKRNGDKNTKKRYCSYKIPIKCEYYCEWLDIKLKSLKSNGDL